MTLPYTDAAPGNFDLPPNIGLVASRRIYLPRGDLFIFEPQPKATSGMVWTRFDDGTESKFIPPVEDKAFRDAAWEMGYGTNAAIYGIEHDMTHHWLAWALGVGVSRIVWADAHKCWSVIKAEDEDGTVAWPFRMCDEEHLVNRMQAYLKTGKVDDHGVLAAVWGDRLPLAAQHLNAFLRPWLRPKGKFKPPQTNLSIEAAMLWRIPERCTETGRWVRGGSQDDPASPW